MPLEGVPPPLRRLRRLCRLRRLRRSGGDAPSGLLRFFVPARVPVAGAFCASSNPTTEVIFERFGGLLSRLSRISRRKSVKAGSCMGWQAMRELGYTKSALCLEHEAGVRLKSTLVTQVFPLPSLSAAGWRVCVLWMCCGSWHVADGVAPGGSWRRQ